jgi:uroporphyrinogen-III synthase
MARPTLLLTRPKPQSDRFALQLRAALGEGLAVVVSPIMRIEPVTDLPDVFRYDGLILTSENAVNCLPKADPNQFIPVYCVGDRTALAAQTRGYSAISAGGAADDLVALVALCEPGGSLLHLHGEHTRGDVAGKLGARGLTVEGHVAYRQIANPLTEEAKCILEGKGPVVVPLFSPRSAKLFCAQIHQGAQLFVAALSSAVLDVVPPENVAKAVVADTPNGTAMIRAVTELVEHAAVA